MKSVVFLRFMTIIVIASCAVTQSLSPAEAQGLEGCPGTGVAHPVDYYLPNLWGNYVIVSDERRDAEQLAATFPDPVDALSRLHAYCWTKQAERVYFNAQDGLTVDVSMHDFAGSEGATLAQGWFSYRRVNELGLQSAAQSSEQLEQNLNAAGFGQVNLDALSGLVIYAYFNKTEYTLYARRNGDIGPQPGTKVPEDILVRVSVSGDPLVGSPSRQVVAYQVMARIFGVGLFPVRE